MHLVSSLLMLLLLGDPNLPPGYSQKVTLEGIDITFSVQHLDAKRKDTPFYPHDLVAVSFDIRDQAGGAPINGVYPAAWLDRISIARPKATNCVRKAGKFIAADVFSQPTMNLNVYYVIAMNDDASLSVVDPIFGYGSTKLLAMVPLESPGEDWKLTADQNLLYVSMPDARGVSVVDTREWKSIHTLRMDEPPTKLHLQHDDAYVWATGDHGNVVAFDTRTNKKVASFPTGQGPHDLISTPDDRYLYVTNAGSGTVTVIDIRNLKKIKDIATGKYPISLAWSHRAQAAYVSHRGDGKVVSIGGSDPAVINTIQAGPGLGMIGFSPDYRLGLVVNPEENTVDIIDVAVNRIVQTADVEKGPVQLTFTDRLAYIGHRDSEIVLMIPLDELGTEGAPVHVIDFPGGNNPLQKTANPSRSNLIVQASGISGVLVANEADKAIYFYKEGMAAPMGNFSNYGLEPRAVLTVERNLREVQPGLYQTTTRLREEGDYDVPFFLDAPRLVNCFDFTVTRPPEKPAPGPRILIEVGEGQEKVAVGKKSEMHFRLVNGKTQKPIPNVKDLQVLVFSMPNWQFHGKADHVKDGVYQTAFIAPHAGHYQIHVSAPSLGLEYQRAHVLRAERL